MFDGLIVISTEYNHKNDLRLLSNRSRTR